MSSSHMRAFSALAFISAAFLLLGCGSDNPAEPDPVVVGSVTVSPATLSLTTGATGSTGTLGASVRDARGEPILGRTIGWSSSATSIARVDANGLVTAVAPGTATITASTGGRSGTATVTVTASQPVEPVNTVTVTTALDTLEAFEGRTLAAVLRDAGGNVLTGREVRWTSSDPAVATIEATTGRLVGVDRGTVTVTATSEGKSGTATRVVVIKYRSIVTGSMHACDIASGGIVWCWGLAGREGRLGDGRTGDGVSSNAPVRVSGTVRFVQLSAFARHTCGIATDGRAYCWGYNGWGQLGAGQSVNQVPTPVAVAGDLQFRTIAAAAEHSCAITNDNRTYCWGLNDAGQLGTGNTTTGNAPVLVTGGHSFASVAGGSYSTCGVTQGSVAMCWGSATQGLLGSTPPTSGRATAPVPIASNLPFRSVSVGNLHACGVTTNGQAFCWGANSGRLGNGNGTDANTPQPVAGGISFLTVSAGYAHSCGISTEVAVWCWGFNRYGQLGVATPGQTEAPVRIPGFTASEVSVAGIGTGTGGHSCAISIDRLTSYCWGLNDAGQGGNGTTTPESAVNATPTVVQGQRPR